MSATAITWADWYLAAGITAADAHRAHVEHANPGAILGPEHWTGPAGPGRPAPQSRLLARRQPAPRPHVTRCAWCRRPVREGAPIGIRNAQPVHLGRCLARYDAHHAAPNGGR
jgi:hypothetical protein